MTSRWRTGTVDGSGIWQHQFSPGESTITLEVQPPFFIGWFGQAGSGGIPRTTTIRHFFASQGLNFVLLACVLSLFFFGDHFAAVTQRDNDARPAAGALVAPERAKTVFEMNVSVMIILPSHREPCQRILPAAGATDVPERGRLFFYCRYGKSGQHLNLCVNVHVALEIWFSFNLDFVRVIGKQFVGRPVAGAAEGTAVATADSPFNVTMVCLAVYILVSLLGIGLLQQVRTEECLSASRQIEQTSYLPVKEWTFSLYVCVFCLCVLDMDVSLKILCLSPRKSWQKACSRCESCAWKGEWFAFCCRYGNPEQHLYLCCVLCPCSTGDLIFFAALIFPVRSRTVCCQACQRRRIRWTGRFWRHSENNDHQTYICKSRTQLCFAGVCFVSVFFGIMLPLWPSETMMQGLQQVRLLRLKGLRRSCLRWMFP